MEKPLWAERIMQRVRLRPLASMGMLLAIFIIIIGAS